MLLIVMTVTVYGAFIEAESPAGYHLIDEMRRELQTWGIPMMAVIMILPFVTGLATGMAVGYIGASFPIILSLIGETPSFGDMMANTIIAYGFGYMGFVLSPVHVCLILSSKHFNTEVLRNVVGLLPPALTLLVFILALSRFWQLVLS